MAKSHNKRSFDEIGIPLITPVTPIPISEFYPEETFKIPRTIQSSLVNEERVVLDYYQLTAEQFKIYQSEQAEYWAEIMLPMFIKEIMAERDKERTKSR